MALITQNNAGVAFSSLLAPFTSVATATVRPLKAITATELATLREGDIVYVQSLRDYFKWLPFSSLAANDITICAPTVVGAGLGRFERLLVASPDWQLQAAWFIDSTAANQEGDGSAIAPLQSDVELQRRWGIRPQLSVPTVVTYVNSPTTQTNLKAQILSGASLLLSGVKTVVKTGTISAVTPVTIATPWDITGTGLDATDVLKIIQITASTAPANVGAYAVISKDLGANKVRTSGFGTLDVVVNPFNVITPIVGDTFEVITVPQLNVGCIAITQGSNVAPVNAPLQNLFMIDLLTLAGTTIAKGLIDSKVPTFTKRVRLSNITCVGQGPRFDFCGIGIVGPVDLQGTFSGGGATFSQSFRLLSGAILAPVTFSSGSCSGLGRPLVQGSNGGLPTSGAFILCPSTAVISGGFYFLDGASDACVVPPGAIWRHIGGAQPDTGTNNVGYGIVVRSGGAYVYDTKPAINATLGVGRETKVGGTDKLYAAIPYVEGANGAILALFA